MIRTRLALWNIFVVAVLLGGFGVAVYFSLEYSLLKSVDDQLNQRAIVTSRFWPPPQAPQAPQGPPNPPPASSTNQPSSQPQSSGMNMRQWRRIAYQTAFLYPRFYRTDGSSYFGEPLSTPNRDERPRIDRTWDRTGIANASLGQTSTKTIMIGERPVRVLSMPLKDRGKVTGIVQLAEPLDENVAELDRLLTSMRTIIPIGLLVAAVAAWFMTDRALSPVGSMAAATRRIGASNISERLPLRGEDEFANLAMAINAMLDRIEHAYEAQRSFTANASHELKSPLTAIKLRLGIALKAKRSEAEYVEHLQAIDRSIESMSTIVQALLLLSRAEEGTVTITNEAVSVESVLKEAMNLTRFRGVKIDVDAEIGAKMIGESRLLAQAVANLLDNAARYTPENEHVRIVARSLDNEIQIRIEDKGPGIPPEEIEKVFDRFYRVSSARDRETGGHGLGLAICRKIVEIHRGRVWLESTVGIGTTAVVRIPSAS